MLVTYTGKPFDYNNITKEDIDIHDIFRALPRINRFNGHSSRVYSVAEHSLYCLFMAEQLGYTPRQKFLTFIHDFTEGYVGDCPTPLKNLLSEFKGIEERVEKAIYEYFEIEPPTEEEYALIKQVDYTMLVIEMRDLTLHDHRKISNDVTIQHILDDENFVVPKRSFSDDMLRDSLYTELDDLLEEMKNG